MWTLINRILTVKNLYIAGFTIIVVLLGIIYFYKLKLNYLEERYNNLKMEKQILENNIKILKQKNESLSKTIGILKQQKEKAKIIIEESKNQRKIAKKIIPKNKARLSYDEQRKVINYINSIFNDN